MSDLDRHAVVLDVLVRYLRDVLLLEHVMELLGFETPRAARRWIRDAGVPFVKVGKRITIRREALLRRLAEIEAGR